MLKRGTLSADEVIDEREVLVGELIALDLDDETRDALQRFVFEQAGRPPSYAVTFSERREESGGGAAIGQVLIELVDHAEVAAWVVLAEMVAEWLRSRVK